jgi:two-component system sensor histidine kinase ResE
MQLGLSVYPLDILDASRIESGKFILHTTKSSLNDIVLIAVENASQLVKNGIVKLLTNFAGDIIVDMDADRVMQVFSNLLNNAIAHTHSGKISISTHKESDFVKVTIKDTGTGIASSFMSRLFMKFASSSDKGSGTGLGLYVSKAIVEAHGGTISGENNPDGKGASFHFTLPAVAKARSQ